MLQFPFARKQQQNSVSRRVAESRSGRVSVDGSVNKGSHKSECSSACTFCASLLAYGLVHRIICVKIQVLNYILLLIYILQVQCVWTTFLLLSVHALTLNSMLVGYELPSLLSLLLNNGRTRQHGSFVANVVWLIVAKHLVVPVFGSSQQRMASFLATHLPGPAPFSSAFAASFSPLALGRPSLPKVFSRV